jgi:hypothetical protein
MSAKDASYGFEYSEDGVFLLAEYEDIGGRPLPIFGGPPAPPFRVLSSAAIPSAPPTCRYHP